MKKTLILLSLMALPLLAGAQQIDSQAAIQPGSVNTADTGLVSITARASDVRDILHSLFTQSKKNYVLEPGVRFVLYLSLEKVDFDEALMIVLKQANLKADIQNGIYYVGKAPAAKPVQELKLEPKKEEPKKEEPKKEEPKVAKPKGTLPLSVLSKKLTTRFTKIDIRALFTELSRQTAVAIEVDKSVPDLKLDAFLINTSLKYSLDQVTAAAGLSYRFTDNLSIQIYKPQIDTNRVSIIAGNDK